MNAPRHAPRNTGGMSRKTIRCACCRRPKYCESDPQRAPGHYFRARLRGWCSCVENERGFTLKLGPLARGVRP